VEEEEGLGGEGLNYVRKKGGIPLVNSDRKGRKCSKPLKSKTKLILGENITMDQVVKMSSKTLIG
jgi:hypothetical protein